MSAGRNIALDRLRVALTILVVAHHCALAYLRNGRFDREHYLWSTAPIVDDDRWIGFDLFSLFNDSFFMALMFLLSGLFVWPSIARKGPTAFLKERAWRLGASFVVVILSVMPAAYYPSFLLTGSQIGFFAFWKQAITIGPWPAGPAWFVWLLLAFDVAALCLRRASDARVAVLGKKSLIAKDRPATLFCIMIGLSALAYCPMAFLFGPTRWLGFGPFDFQASRLFLYGLYFLSGVVLGAGGVDRGLLSFDGALKRQWLLWTGGAFAAFAVFVIVQILQLRTPLKSSVILDLAYCLSLVLCCGAASFAAAAVFLRFQAGRKSIFDALLKEAYGVYLLHYFFVVWLQFALLGLNMAAVLKAAIVFSAALALSMASVFVLRKNRVVAKII